jgi:G protein beta subunit-like protein
MVVLLATGGYDYTIRFWDASSGVCYKSLQHPDKQVNSLAISPDKQFIAAAGNPQIKLYDVNSKGTEPIATFEGHTSNVTCVGFQKEGRWLFSSSEDGTVKVWDPRAPGFQRNYEARAAVNSVVLHPNQGELIAGDLTGTVRVLDLTANACSAELVPEGDAAISSVSIAADASLLAAANFNGHVYFWTPNPSAVSASNGFGTAPADITKEEGTSAEHQQQEQRQQDAAAAQAQAQAQTRTLRLDSGSYTPVKLLAAHKAYILSARISPDVRYIATASSDRTVKLWSVADGTYALSATLTGHSRWVWDGVFSADSNYLVTASSDASCKLWEVATGEVVRTYTGHAKAISAVALNDAPPVMSVTAPQPAPVPTPAAAPAPAATGTGTATSSSAGAAR